MIRSVSEKIVNLLMLKAKTKADKEVYIYGLECFISEFIGNLLLFIFAFIFKKTAEIFIWTISFLAIRTQLGGYHCSNHLRCLLLSTLLGIGGIVLNIAWIKSPISAFLIILYCFIFLIKHAPIIHKNHPLTKSQKRKSKMICMFNFCLMTLIAIFFAILKISLYTSFCSGIILAALLGNIQVIINRINAIKDAMD